MENIKIRKVRFFFKVVKHDIKESKKYLLYLLCVSGILILFTCLFLQRDILRGIDNGMITKQASYSDFLFRMMEGMPVFKIEGPSTIFKIPAVWICFHWWLSYIVGAYVVKDLKVQGVNILLRVQNRKIWWLGKCMWALCMVFLYYIFLLGVLFVFVVTSGIGECTFTLTPQLHGLNKEAAAIFSEGRLFILGVIIPCLISIGIVFLQMAIILYSNQLTANVVIIVLFIASAYISNPLLPGNYLMLLRFKVVAGNEGVLPETGIIIAFIMILVAIIMGTIKFEKYDIR